MRDEDKSKEQLIKELKELRRQAKKGTLNPPNVKGPPRIAPVPRDHQVWRTSWTRTVPEVLRRPVGVPRGGAESARQLPRAARTR